MKRWFHGQTEQLLVVLDGADTIDDDESYPNPEFFLLDALTMDVTS